MAVYIYNNNNYIYIQIKKLSLILFVRGSFHSGTVLHIMV